MSVGCIHQDFQVVLFLLMFLSKPPKATAKTPGTNGTKANLVVTYAFQGCGGVLEAHVPHQSTRLKKGAPFCRKSYDGWSWCWPNTSNCTQWRTGGDFLWDSTELSVLQIWVMKITAKAWFVKSIPKVRSLNWKGVYIGKGAAEHLFSRQLIGCGYGWPREVSRWLWLPMWAEYVNGC